MTLTLEIPKEKEEIFKNAAQRQGLSVAEFLLDAAERALTQTLVKETARLAAIQELKGIGRGSRSGSQAIRRDRNEDTKRDNLSFGEAQS